MVYGRAWRHTQRLRALPAISTSSDAAAATAALQCGGGGCYGVPPTIDRRPIPSSSVVNGFACQGGPMQLRSFHRSFSEHYTQQDGWEVPKFRGTSRGPITSPLEAPRGPPIPKFKYIPSNGVLNGFACQGGPMQLHLFHRSANTTLNSNGGRSLKFLGGQ